MFDISKEIKEKQEAIKKIQQQLEEETQRIAELSQVEAALQKAENLVDEAIALITPMPLWVKQQFNELTKQKLDANLVSQEVILAPEEQLFFDCLTQWISDIINNYQRGQVHPFCTGKLTYDSKTKSWHIPIHFSGATICSLGVTVFQMPAKVEDNINLSVFNQLKGWVWGIDARAEWRKAMVKDDEFLIKMLEDIPALYEAIQQQLLTIIQKQISQTVLLKKCKDFIPNNNVFKYLLLDLKQSDKIVFFDKKNLITDDIEEMTSVCYKNVVSQEDQRPQLKLELQIEEVDPFSVFVIPGEGIQWQEEGERITLLHDDILEGNIDPSPFQKKALGAIAAKMGLQSKAKTKDAIWERIQAKYLELTTAAS